MLLVHNTEVKSMKWLEKEGMSYLMQWKSWQWHSRDQLCDFKVTYLLMSSWIYSESSCLGMLKDKVHSSICSRTSIHLVSTVWNLYTLHTGFLNTEREWKRKGKESVWISNVVSSHQRLFKLLICYKENAADLNQLWQLATSRALQTETLQKAHEVWSTN